MSRSLIIVGAFELYTVITYIVIYFINVLYIVKER